MNHYMIVEDDEDIIKKFPRVIQNITGYEVKGFLYQEEDPNIWNKENKPKIIQLDG